MSSTAATGTPKLDRTILIVAAVVLLATVLYPTIRLIYEAAMDWRGDVLTSPGGMRAIWNTLVIGVGTVVFSGIVGTAMAVLLTRYDFPGRNALAAAAYLPFTLPPLVGALSFWYILGLDGFIARGLEGYFGIEDAYIQGPTAILLIHTYSFYVFFYAMVSSALESMDPSLAEAGRSLGESRSRVFRRVTLPLLKPSIIGASLLTFMSSGASFSAPFYFGGDYRVLSTEIFIRQSQGLEGRAAATTLTVILALIALAGLAVFRSRGTSPGLASKGARRSIRGRGGRIAAGAVAWSVVSLLVLPHITILVLAFADHRSWQTQIFPTEWTLDNFWQVFGDARAFQPILNSAWMSAVATIAVIIIALPAAYLVGRDRKYSGLLNFLIMLPWALPGTVVAINLIVAFNDPWLPLYSTVWLLPLAYFVRTVPLFARMATAAIQSFDASLIEAGRTLGASPAQCFWRIAMPLLAPAIGAGAALAFATSLGEYVASILLYMPGNIPISVRIHEQWRGSGIGSAFAYSVFLILLVAATFVASRRFASTKP